MVVWQGDRCLGLQIGATWVRADGVVHTDVFFPKDDMNMGYIQVLVLLLGFLCLVHYMYDNSHWLAPPFSQC